VPAEHLFHRHADLSHTGPGARGLDRRLEQVAALFRPPFQFASAASQAASSRLAPDLLQPRDLASRTATLSMSRMSIGSS
jgi:hypothetical protein